MDHETARHLRTSLLGATMRKIRNDSGRSQNDVAELIGCSATSYSAYERGLKAPPLPELELFAYHLNIPLETLLDPDADLQRGETGFDPGTLVSLRQRMIGAQLKSMREQSGLSNRILSEATNISSRRIAAFQGGKRSIPLPELESLAEALDVTIDDFVDKQGPVGEWIQDRQGMTNLGTLPQDLRAFLAEPSNLPYLHLAKLLSEIPIDNLRRVVQQFLDETA